MRTRLSRQAGCGARSVTELPGKDVMSRMASDAMPYSSIVSSTGQWSLPKTSERIEAPVTFSAASSETRK